MIPPSMDVIKLYLAAGEVLEEGFEFVFVPKYMLPTTSNEHRLGGVQVIAPFG